MGTAAASPRARAKGPQARVLLENEAAHPCTDTCVHVSHVRPHLREPGDGGPACDKALLHFEEDHSGRPPRVLHCFL